MRIICILLFLVSGFNGLSQNPDLPADFLSNEFHKERRAQLRAKMPANSVAVIFSGAVRNRANDVDYRFHQNPDFYYLTGYTEPQSLLLIFKEKQAGANGASYDEIIFVQPRNEKAEMWTGRRLGDEGVKNQLGFSLAYNNKEFKRYNVDFSKFDKILFFDFLNDVRDDPRDSSDLADLIKQFKKKVKYPEKESLTINPEPQKNNLDTQSLDILMDELRGIKTQNELVLLK